MTTSGNKEFNPLVREIIDEAYEICGLDPQDLEDRALRSAKRSLNHVLVEWIGAFVPLWLTTPVSYVMQPFPKRGTDIYDNLPDYPVADVVEPTPVKDERGNVCIQYPRGTEAIRSLAIRLDDRNSFPVPLSAMTDTEWNEYPIRSETETGQPYWFYFRRNDPPLLYFVYAPDRAYNFDGVIQLGPDAVTSSNHTVDIPRRWQSALAWGLAKKLAIKVGVDTQRMQMIWQEAERTYNMAREGEDDNIPLTMVHTEYM